MRNGLDRDELDCQVCRLRLISATVLRQSNRLLTVTRHEGLDTDSPGDRALATTGSGSKTGP